MIRKDRHRRKKNNNDILRTIVIIITTLGLILFVFYSNHDNAHIHSSLKASMSSTSSSSLSSLSSLSSSSSSNTNELTIQPTTSFDVAAISTLSTASQKARKQLFNHPLHQISNETLVNIMKYLSNHSSCVDKPLFISMANTKVQAELYWQLIENFIYTMVKFNLSDCSIMICVSDINCMKGCKENGFPCWLYNHNVESKNEVSALEKIATLKLNIMPEALKQGVDIFMLDLDVGFLNDPMLLVNSFKSQKTDILVQQDVTFIMNRTLEGWRTWYTEPMPNIGLMLVKGNEKTYKIFNEAWRDYLSITAPIKHNPGKDQNKVVNAMKYGSYGIGLKWSYFKVHNAVLLDKIYKFESTTFEIGGKAADDLFHKKGTIAAHTTCYEQKTKVMGLKAVNAFWNPNYYDPNRRTLTKRLLYSTDNNLEEEIHSLMYLASITNRTLIIPNILAHESLANIRKLLKYKGQVLWPGFRVAYFHKKSNLQIDIAEPAFYWRVQRDYSKDVPDPYVVPFGKNANFKTIESQLLSDKVNYQSRVVIDISPTYHGENTDRNDERILDTIKWAQDSVGLYNKYDEESKKYLEIPKIYHRYIDQGFYKDYALVNKIKKQTRLCDRIFMQMKGNRSCFDKCD